MKTAVWTLIFALLLPISAAAQPPTGPEPRTRALIEAFLSVHTPPEGASLDPAARKANADAFSRLDGFFDWGHLSEAPITPHKEKLSAAQLERLRAAFRETVRWVAYPDSGDFFRTARWSVESVAGSDVTLHVRLLKEDVETRITFHWKQVAGAWRIVDVSFDGASLVHDYQNQFGRIIAKHGAGDLIQRLEKRRDEERLARKGLLP